MKSDEFQPSQNTKLCERHFEKDQFVVNPELAVSIRVPSKSKRIDLGTSTIHLYHSNPKTKLDSHGKRLPESPVSMYKALKRKCQETFFKP